jgi:hypothetical protein
MVTVRAGQSWAWIGLFGASTATASVAAMSLSGIASLPRLERFKHFSRLRWSLGRSFSRDDGAEALSLRLLRLP